MRSSAVTSAASSKSSSVPRSLLIANMAAFGDNEQMKTFDDAKSDITAISMSAMSTRVNAPRTPPNSNEVERMDFLSANTSVASSTRKRQQRHTSSPLTLHVSALPSASRLSQDTGTLIKQVCDTMLSEDVFEVFLVKNAENVKCLEMFEISWFEQQTFLSDEEEDKLKVFGYVYEEDNDNGLFSCIINNADAFLSLTLSLINSVIQFEQKQMAQTQRAQNMKQKRKRGNQKVCW